MTRRTLPGLPRVALAFALACLGHRSVAAADEAASARADERFKEGKARMAAADFAAACPLLAESFALDPATGALLALALCHEREGKLASAHREYAQAAARSAAEGRKDREQAARDKVAALEGKLSTLTIAVAAGDAAITVRVDGAAFDPAQLGKPASFDGGEHLIEVSAPEMKPWSTKVVLGSSAAAKTVLVPALEPEPSLAIAAAAPLSPSPAAPRKSAHAQPRTRHTDTTLSATEWLGVGTIVVGLAGVGAGTYFAIEAGNQSDEAKMGCDRDVCTPKAAQARIDSTAAQNASALAFVIGGLLATTGLAIYLTHASSSASETATAASNLTATAWASPEGGGAVVRGGF